MGWCFATPLSQREPHFIRKNKDAARLHEMLCSWQQAAAKLEAGEIFHEEYDRWRYQYPEFDRAQTYVKVPPQDLV